MSNPIRDDGASSVIATITFVIPDDETTSLPVGDTTVTFHSSEDDDLASKYVVLIVLTNGEDKLEIRPPGAVTRADTGSPPLRGFGTDFTASINVTGAYGSKFVLAACEIDAAQGIKVKAQKPMTVRA